MLSVILLSLTDQGLKERMELVGTSFVQTRWTYRTPKRASLELLFPFLFV